MHKKTTTNFALFFFQYLSLIMMFNVFPAENSQSHDQKIFILTTQKSGTHLLQKALRMIINSENLETHGILLKHIRPELCKENEYKKIVLLRDPRDIFVAQNYFLTKYPWRENHPWIKTKDLYDKVYRLPFDERLTWIITHPDEYLGVRDSIKLSLELIKDPLISIVRFEDLVGPSGGGDLLKQEMTIQNIALLIGHPISPNEIKYICTHLFGGTNSFRKGQIGSWREHFLPHHKESFKKFMGQELIDLGYEENNDW